MAKRAGTPDKSPLRAWLESLTEEHGLRGPDLARALGPGLRRLWDINVNDDYEDVSSRVATEFERAISKLEGSPGQPSEYCQTVARVSFNLGYREIWKYSLPGRQKWLNTRPGARGRQMGGPPRVSIDSQQTCMCEVYSLIEETFMADWKLRFSDEPFPNDVPMSYMAASGKGIYSKIVTSPAAKAARSFRSFVRPFWRTPAPAIVPESANGFHARIKSFLRRRPVLSGFGVVAVVAVLVVGTTVLVAPTSHTPAARAVPESILRTTLLSATSIASDLGAAFPAALSAKASDYVTRLHNGVNATGYDQFFQDEMNDGAYAAGGLSVKVELEGIVDDEVTVTDIRVTNLKREPLPLGTLITLTTGGAGPYYVLYYSLDQPVPIASKEEPQAGKPVQPFVTEESMGISKGNKVTVDLNLEAQTVAVTFDVAIDFEYQGQKYTQILHRTPSGQPFRTAALVCDKDPIQRNAGVTLAELTLVKNLRYGRVYKFASTLDASGNYTLESVDPNSFATACY